MSIATICTRGFGSFGAIRFVVTRGYSIGSTPTPPVITTPQGGGTSHKLRKGKKPTVIRFSDFGARDEYEKKLRDAVVRSGLILADADAAIGDQEARDAERHMQDASDADAMRRADTEIRISADLRANLQAVRNDEAAMMMILLTML